ncbi:MAG: DNA methyltransferase [Dehalococcoidia bacterium]
MPAERKSKTIDQPSQPITTAARFIAEWTNPIVGSVLDFSCGSGTTGEACLRLYRDFVGVDNDPVKITLSRNRLETIKPKSMQFEMAELNRQIVNDLARVKKWAPETL